MRNLKSVRRLLQEQKAPLRLFVVLLIGILLLLFGGIGSKNTPTPANEKQAVSSEDLEQQLEDILCQIQGVGKVKVMITLEDNGSHELATDIQNTKRGEESNLEEKTVILNGGGNASPYVIREKNANVKGVIVVAEGGGNPSVCDTIQEAVASVLTVMPHRITVAEMRTAQKKNG